MAYHLHIVKLLWPVPTGRHRRAQHLSSAGGLQHPGALRNGGAGGDDVVQQQNPLTGQGFGTNGPVRPQHIGPPLLPLPEGGLGRVVADLFRARTGFCPAPGPQPPPEAGPDRSPGTSGGGDSRAHR